MRAVVLILILTLSYTFAFSQSTGNLFQIYSKIGLQAGGPIYHSNTIESKKGSPGFNPLGGVGLSYSIYKRFQLAIEIFYSRRKINYSSQVRNQFYNDQQIVVINNQPFVYDIETTFTGATKGSFDLQYLEAPLLFQYSVNNKLMVEIGPYYAWAFYRKNIGTATGIVGRTDIPNPSYINNRPYDNSSHLNSHYFGILAGAQYKLCSRASVDLRLTYSFNSLYNRDWQGVNYTLKDLYGQLSVNYFLLKK